MEGLEEMRGAAANVVRLVRMYGNVFAVRWLGDRLDVRLLRRGE